jgi:hydrogenase expression/formation protein HypE
MERILIKGVLFDFDDTLTYPGALDFPAIKRQLGCPLDQPILEFLDTLPSAKRKKVMKALEAFEQEAAEISHPNEGAERVIVELKKKGILLGILTRNSLISVETALRNFNGASIQDFAAIITRDESLPKPHPDGVYKAAKQMGISTNEILMVGDFRFDIIAGKTAGANTVLLAKGRGSEISPDDPEPDYTITHLEEILDLV